MANDNFLDDRLDPRSAEDNLRTLRLPSGLADFCSNDYLGIVKNELLPVASGYAHGSTGSRLLTGNSMLAEQTEQQLARFHGSESALIFNSGYDANLGLLSSVPGKSDTILYDFLSHASIRDGIRLNPAKSYSFRHNDPDDLVKKIRLSTGRLFVVTESVFSMDGDIAPLTDLVKICDQYDANLIVDEAHATGVCGPGGAGIVQALNLQRKCFARIHTFGKALGCHGAVVLGSDKLRKYLVNFCRSLIYTTAPPPSMLAAITASYNRFPGMDQERAALNQLVKKFSAAQLRYQKLQSDTPIQGVVIPGNQQVKMVAESLRQSGLDVRPILYPTVPKESERLRIVLHSYNTEQELNTLINQLS